MTGGVDHPEAHDIFQITEPVIVAAFIREVMLLAELRCVGCLPLNAHERPCAGADVYEIIVIRRYGKHCGSCIMGAGCDDLAVVADLFRNLRAQMTDLCSRHYELLENSSRITEFIDQFPVIFIGLRTDQLTGRCFGVLVYFFPCEQEMIVIRRIEQRLRLLEILRMFLLDRHQLVNGVEDGLLNTCAAIKLPLRNDFVNFLIHSVGTMITITHRVADDLVILVQENKINAPRINAYIAGLHTHLAALLECRDNFLENSVVFPAEFPVFLHQAVFKTMDFLQLELSVLDPAKHHSSA